MLRKIFGQELPLPWGMNDFLTSVKFKKDIGNMHRMENA